MHLSFTFSEASSLCPLLKSEFCCNFKNWSINWFCCKLSWLFCYLSQLLYQLFVIIWISNKHLLLFFAIYRSLEFGNIQILLLGLTFSMFLYVRWNLCLEENIVAAGCFEIRSQVQVYLQMFFTFLSLWLMLCSIKAECIWVAFDLQSPFLNP